MKILICGVGGRMGREVAKMALDGYRNAIPVAGVDVVPVDTREFRTYTDWNAVEETPDCIIDFSHHTGTPALLKYACQNNIPVVLATTGHDYAEQDIIKEASQKIPLFHSANMSLGIALLVELAKTTAKAFPDADIEIVSVTGGKLRGKKLSLEGGETAKVTVKAAKFSESAKEKIEQAGGKAEVV